jgi:sulfide:quinone oxidoreductase
MDAWRDGRFAREILMANIVVLGAGLSGTLMAYELAPQLRRGDTLSLVGEGKAYDFVPSNPWVAIGWRRRSDISVDLTAVMRRKNIRFHTQGAKRLHPAENRIELNGGDSPAYDYLVIATGPELAFDEVPGLGPDGFTQSVCQAGHALKAHEAFEAFAKNPGPIVTGAVQNASCFGPAYEFTFILDTELRRRKIRDKVPMTFVTSEPYIGHLGLDGVGDTKGLLESALRDRHIKWIASARVKSIEAGKLLAEEIAEDGQAKKLHELPFAYAMLLPAFRGVKAVCGIEGLTNPRGFVIADKHQRNPKFPNIFSVGVGMAIPPVAQYPVPVGVPKTGFMIESMVAATARNIAALLRGREPETAGTWNAICLADFGDSGIAFFAEPQIPPRNVNWSSKGKWVHYAKIAFEKYFLRKIRTGNSEPFYERWMMHLLGIRKLTKTRKDTA